MAFLEGNESKVADERIREFLKCPGEPDARENLQHLLERNPGWTSAPFAEALESAQSWWRRWVQRTSPEQLALWLEPLLQRPDDRARQVAKAFVNHNDPAVARLATRVASGCD